MNGDITSWLEEQGLGKYAATFVANEVDLVALPELTEEDLREMGVAIGARRKLLKAIRELADGADSQAPATMDASDAERRQLSVMFCDLVGSTELSTRIDAEDLRTLITRFQTGCAGAVEPLNGFVARYMGDGVMVYFGYPKAHEDDAERAVAAGLAVLEATALLDVGVRVGIATGRVIVGDLLGTGPAQERTVVGETPNLAARLQGLAEPGTVVVSETTRTLAHGGFDFATLGRHSLKGFAEPVPAWRVLSARAGETRFETRHGATLAPMVGRGEELQRLLGQWHRAQAGEGGAVLLSGEAGIGKSRLVEAVREAAGPTTIRYQCSPHHGSSALYPTTQQLARAAGFAPNDDDETRLDKLEALLSRATGEIERHAPLFAHLLSLPYAARYGELTQTPQQIKGSTLEALVSQLLRLADIHPVLFLVEDAHWIDPTSLELLEIIVGRIQQARVFLIVTHRTEWQSPFGERENVTRLHLNRLDPQSGAELARAIAGDFVSAHALERIVSRTDGVPLFIEELTRSLIEGGLDAAEADVPATLQASLLARVDRLDRRAKEYAQIGAAIGREFDRDLLVATVGQDESRIDHGLAQLVRSDLVRRTGGARDALYSFRHALIQDTIYDSMLRDVRRARHARIAAALRSVFPDTVDNAPELLAHHYGAADMAEQAIDFWHRAGVRSAARSANAESIEQIGLAIDLLERQRPTPALARQGLKLHIDLTGPLIAAHGHASPAMERNVTRALALSQETGETSGMFPILYGRWVFHFVTGKTPRSVDLGREFLTLAQRDEHRELIVLGHRILGHALLCAGHSSEAHAHLIEAANYDAPEEERAAPFVYGQDVQTAAMCIASWSCFHRGWADQAVAFADRALARARSLEHPNTLAYTLTHTGFLFLWLRAEERLRGVLDEMQAVNRKHALPVFRASAELLEVGYKCITGDNGGVLDTAAAALQNYQDLTRMLYLGPGMRAWAAQAQAALGEAAAARESVREALELAERTGETFQVADILRIGALAVQTSGDDEATVVAFTVALDAARDMASKPYELRAATNLACFHRSRGEPERAVEVLAPVYASFTEGQHLPDLREARALLEELR